MDRLNHYLLLFTNLTSEMPLGNKAFFWMVIEIASSPTKTKRVLRQFRGSKNTTSICHFSGKPSTTRLSVSEESVKTK